MRVIAGTARRMNLKTPDGLDTRPTQDRIKETLFNIIQFDLMNKDVLDLFAGSGALGIEALSRGAARAVFCDSAREAILCIEENLQKTHFKEQSLVLSGDYNGAINSLMRKDYHFGLIFMDPPYGRELAEKALIRLKDKAFVSQDTLFVVEAGLQEDFSGMEEEGYSILREKIYKTNKHVFLRLKGEIG